MQVISKKKFFWAGIAIAILNPVFAGLIIGALYLSEPSSKKQGQIILAIAIGWGLISAFLVQRLQGWLTPSIMI